LHFHSARHRARVDCRQIARETFSRLQICPDRKSARRKNPDGSVDRSPGGRHRLERSRN
jgi:hypothetical protein